MNNVCILVGRLTRDPELRKNEKVSACMFTLAINRNIKNNQGEYETDFIDCVAFNKTGELITEYCQKGDLIGVSGRIQKRNYEDKDGNKRYVTEIIVNSVNFLANGKGQSNNESNGSEEEFNPNEIVLTDDDLPF